MRTLSKLAVLTALVLAPVGTTYAQVSVDAGAAGSIGGSANGTVGDSTGSGSVGTSVDASATGSVSTNGTSASDVEANYGALISSLNSATASVDLGSINSDAEVRVVFVSSLEGQAGAKAKALDNALEKNAGASASLHASIEANTSLKAKLDGQNIDIEDVVAVTAAADGSLTVFVDDRQG